MFDQKNARSLILKWGDSTIVITRIPEVLPQVTEEDPVVLVDADLNRIDAVCRQKGREIGEYLSDGDYWRTEDEPSEHIPERPPWAAESFRLLFRAIDAGDLQFARSLKWAIEQAIGPDDPTLARADVLMRRKEIIGR